jgi:hypothetical protein
LASSARAAAAATLFIVARPSPDWTALAAFLNLAELGALAGTIDLDLFTA